MRTTNAFMLASVCACLVSACDSGNEGNKADARGIRGMATAKPRTLADASGNIEESLESEPNNDMRSATRLEIAPGENFFNFVGSLDGGGADKDVYLIPHREGIDSLSIKLAPEGGGDLVIGLATDERPPVLFDTGVAGVAEFVPNVRLHPGGTYFVVSGRGGEDLRYRVELVFKSTGGMEEGEPNERLADASRVVEGATVAYANRSGDVDFFSIILPEGQPASLTLTPPSSSPARVQLTVDGETVWEALAKDGKAQVFQGLAPGREYFAQVEIIGEVTHPDIYQLRIDRLQGAGAFEIEPNDDPLRAQVISVSEEPLRASIRSAQDQDHFRAVVPGGAEPYVVKLEARPGPQSKALDLGMRVRLVEQGLEQERATGGPGSPEGLCNVAAMGGSTTLEVLVNASAVSPEGANEYGLMLTKRPLQGEEREPNFSPESATPMTLTDPIKGFIHPKGDVDMYRFSVPALASDPEAEAFVTIKTIGAYPANLILDLKVKEGMRVATVAHRDDKLRNEPEEIAMNLPPGLYFVEVRAYEEESCDTPYQLSVEFSRSYIERLNTEVPGETPQPGVGPVNPPTEPVPTQPPVDGPGEDDF